MDFKKIFPRQMESFFRGQVGIGSRLKPGGYFRNDAHIDINRMEYLAKLRQFLPKKCRTYHAAYSAHCYGEGNSN